MSILVPPFTSPPMDNESKNTAAFVGAPCDFNDTRYEISEDLEIRLVIFGQNFWARGERREQILEMLDSLRKEYEEKAFALDIKEGNHE